MPGVGKIFEFTRKDAVCLVDRGLRIPSDVFRHGNILEEEPGLIFLPPFEVRLRIRGNTFLQPRFKGTILPFVLRHLRSDVACVFAEGVRNAKEKPPKTV